MKKLIISLTICLISVCMLGCQSVTRKDHLESAPVNDIPVITENAANREANGEPEIQPDSRANMILEADAKKIALAGKSKMEG